MAARIALVLSAAFLCLMLGLVFAPATPAVVAPAHPLRVADLRLSPSAAGAAVSAALLAGSAPPPAPGAAGPRVAAAPRREYIRLPPPPPPPVPPGADEVLRGSVAAVTDDGGRLSLVLAGGGRRLRDGDRFMGWTLASVNRSGAVLRKGDARRDVSFFAPGSSGTGMSAPASGLAPAALPSRRSSAPTSKAPTADEFFRGFKG